MRILAGIALAVLVAAAPGAGMAQSDDNKYEDALLRLSEILGAVHFLSALCDTEDEAGIWRRQMEALLEAEEAFPQRRRLMTIRFNRGFTTYSDVYRSCSGSAQEALARHRSEGGEITLELVTLYARQ